MSTYTAHAQRSSGYWAIYVPKVDRWTQARKVSEIEPMAQDLVAIMTEHDAGDITISVDLQLPGNTPELITQAEELRQQAAQAQSQAAETMRTAARALVGSGLSQQEVADVLHVSKQRASQLLHAKPKDARSPA